MGSHADFADLVMAIICSKDQFRWSSFGRVTSSSVKYSFRMERNVSHAFSSCAVSTFSYYWKHGKQGAVNGTCAGGGMRCPAPAVQNGPDHLAGVIGEALEMPAPTLSFHLKTLARMGWWATQEGAYNRYRAAMPAIRALAAFLPKTAARGGFRC